MSPVAEFNTSLYPLSTPQREIWFDQMLHAKVPLYNIGGCVDLPGGIDPLVFGRAVNLLVRRHDSLRLQLTGERDEDGLPLQTFVAPWPVRVPVVDASSEMDPEAAAHTFMRQRFEEPFDLEGQPLFRYDLVKLTADHYYWLVRYHHLIIDGWGAALLNRSMACIYSELASAGDPEENIAHGSMREAPSYSAYINDDRAYVESPKFEQQRIFWQGHHPQPPEPLLTTSYRRVFSGALVGSGCEAMFLPRAFHNRLGDLAQDHGVSLFHVLLAALYVYFSRISQCNAVTIGLPVLNRANAAYKQTAGLFANQSPVRFACGQDLSFAEVLGQVSATLKAVYRHQRFPASEIRRAAGAGSSCPRLFDLGLSYENHDYQSCFAGINGHFTALLHSWEQTPLQIYVRDFHADSDVRLDFVFNQAYFSIPEIRALHERIRVVLQAALSHPECVIGALPILPDAERQLLLHAWNNTHGVFHTDQCLHQLFEAQANRSPDAIALLFEAQSLTYSQLNARANRLAHHLIRLGIGPDDRVGIGIERSLDMAVGLLAILKAGAAYVPLDPAYPKERLAFMLEDSAPVALLVHGATRQLFDSFVGNTPTIDLDADKLVWASLCSDNPDPASLALRPDHLAYVIYTSGSTGIPKGVMVEHRGVASHCLEYGNRHGLTVADRVALMAELSFDASVEQLFPVLLVGGHVVLTKFDLDPVSFSHQINAHGLTLIDVAAMYWRSLVHCWLEQPDLISDSPLRILIVGGDVMPAEVLPLWRQTSLSRTVQLFNVYGPTETTVASTVFAVPHDFAGLPIPIGRPLPNKRLYVLDRDGHPVPIGVAGEIHIGGAGVARGYLNRPELTAERFLPDPFSREPHARMYRTGDLARWLPDGNLEFLGRSDFQVKIRGFRIELGEIEAALRSSALLQDAVVLAREDLHGEKRLVAYVTADALADPTDPSQLPALLKAHLQSTLPESMVPAAFVVLPAFPLTPNGKLDRNALPAPDADAYASRPYAPPTGPVEETLANLWQDLLGIDRISRHDDFFSLGGHSLLALRLLSAMEPTFGVRLPVGVVFLMPTLAGLAEAVGDTQLAEEAASLVPLQPEGQAPPLFLLPGAIGSVLYLRPLATALGQDRPVFALPSPGLDGRPPLKSVPELATHHLRALRRQQPRGPYHLAGHSSGGRIAYEMARQLEEQGESVGALVILDTNAPDPHPKLRVPTGQEMLADLVAVFEELSGMAFSLSREVIITEPDDQIARAMVMKAFQDNGVLFAKGAPLAELQALAEVYRAALLGHETYRLRGRVQAPIHLLKAREQGGADGVVDLRPAWGWRDGSEQDVQVDVVPGSHITMMATPQVEILANRLQRILSGKPVFSGRTDCETALIEVTIQRR